MYSFVDRLARLFAQLGGLVLAALIILTCLSIAGRSLNGVLHADWIQTVLPGVATALLDLGIGPINGDFELVEAGMAFSIFAFLPLCQLNGAHAAVNVFTSALPMRANRLLRTVIEVVFAGVLILIAWQLFEGMQSKRSTAQTTFLLEFPVWWGYAVSLVAAVVAALVSVYVAGMRVVETLSGRRVLPPELEADH
ncbi:MAG: TRAP transporter small permease [Ahrensia sp.]|nr:TRAP transporter small permease [Ahrensia sp.]